MSEYEVRLMREEDAPKIIELLNIVFDDWPDKDLDVPKLEHYKWKYMTRKNQDNLSAIIKKDDKIIGSNHGFPINVKIGDNTVKCNQATDFCVHPDFRRMGLSKLMSSLKSDLFKELKYRYLYVITENQIVIDANLRKGSLLFPKPFKELVRIKNIKKHLQNTDGETSLIKETGFNLIKQYKKIMNSLLHNKEDNEIEIKNITKFDETIDDFYERVKNNYDFIIKRDRDYLNWRYCDIRGGKFNVKIAQEKDKILGYIIVRINRFKPEYPTGWIVDFLVDPDYPAAAEKLIDASIMECDKADVNIIRYWVLEGHPNTKLLQSKGFIDIKKEAPKIIMETLDKGDEWDVFYNAPVERIHLQQGDTEWI